MGVHTMSLLLCCLLALAIPANSLKCYKCVGNDNECSPTEETCPGQNAVCSTSALHIDSFPCKVRKVLKGCVNSTTTTNKISISPSQLVTFSLQQETCNSDLCNKVIPDPVLNRNDLYCHSCISPEINCDSDKMKEMRCTGEQNQCVDMSVIGSFGDIADVSIKGCAHLPSCKENMAFSSQTSSVTLRCCDGNYCNSVIEYEQEDKTPNGIQCYSCNTLDGAGCSPGELDKAQCYGALTSCLHIEGTFTKDGRQIPTMIKGCATPSMCDSSVLPLLQKLEAATVKCCNGSLCNNQSSDSSLQGSGYFPIGNASPGTGNNSAGSGNNSSAGTTGSSSFGGYTNMPGGNTSSTPYTSSGNGTGMTSEWNNSNNSSNHNVVVPVGYVNIPGKNHSSPSQSSSDYGTGITNEWIYSNDSNHNMAAPVGYNNISANNHSSTYYTGNGTGMTYEGINSSSSNHSMSVPGGYANVSGGNGSSTSYASSGNGTGMTHEGINSSSSNHSMSVPGGYANVSGGNGSSTYYASSGNGTGMTHEGINSSSYNHSMSVPGGYANVSGGNGSSTSYAGNGTVPGGSSYYNGTAWIYSSSFNPNMLPNSNGSFSNYSGIQDFLSKLNGSFNESIRNNSYFLNHLPPGMNLNGSGPYNINESLADYFNSLGLVNNPNLTYVSGGNNGSLNHGDSFNNGINTGHESVNSSSYNPNMMIPGVGSGVTDGNGNNMDHGLNGSMLGSGSNTNELVPGRYTNDSSIGYAGNSTGNSTMYNGASSPLAKSGSFVIFSAIVLLVLS